MTYVNAVVSFIDILGFREIVKQRSAEDIKEILDLVTSFATVPGKDKYELCSTVQFSDSVIRVAPVDGGPNSEEPIGVLFHELVALLHAQADLVNSGVLIRGGIAFGEVAIGDGYVFGPAFVRAYDLESRFANFPRIVIDPHLLRAYMDKPLLRAHHHSLSEDKAYIRDLICQGDDGIWFIDYARAVRDEMDAPDEYPLFLEKQKRLVLKSIKGLDAFDSTLAKYFWLARYHNEVAASCSEEACKAAGLSQSDITIGGAEFDLFNPLRI